MAMFYDTVRERGTLTMTGGYASAVARRFFDFGSPLAAYAAIPRSYVVLQRINLGLFAVLGEMKATADWRLIAEEIWPFVQGPPSTPLGEAEARWRAASEAERGQDDRAGDQRETGDHQHPVADPAVPAEHDAVPGVGGVVPDEDLLPGQ
jgi:hypothetical protein